MPRIVRLSGEITIAIEGARYHYATLKVYREGEEIAELSVDDIRAMLFEYTDAIMMERRRSTWGYLGNEKRGRR